MKIDNPLMSSKLITSSAQEPDKKELTVKTEERQREKNEALSPNKNSGKQEILNNYSEWYLRAGKTHENAKNYKEAISAYEKAYSTKPDIQSASSVDHAKSKNFNS